MNRKPAFLGIGAHKAGTTWLYRKLIDHPEIYMPPRKEIHFFDRSPYYPSPNRLAISSPSKRLSPRNIATLDPTDRKKLLIDLARILACPLKGDFEQAMWYMNWVFGYYNDNWYSNLFSHSVSYSVSGEITPAYSMLEPDDINHVRKVNPDMKIIFLIRNPIERAWSAIRFDDGKGRLGINLESSDEIILALKSKSVVLRGDYERTLENYLKYFDSSQILVCFYDAIKNDPTKLLLDITNFLNVSAFGEGSVNYRKRVNPSKPREIPRDVKNYLHETYSPMIDRLAKSLGSYANIWSNTKEEINLKSKVEHFKSQLLPTLNP